MSVRKFYGYTGSFFSKSCRNRNNNYLFNLSRDGGRLIRLIFGAGIIIGGCSMAFYLAKDNNKAMGDYMKKHPAVYNDIVKYMYWVLSIIGGYAGLIGFNKGLKVQKHGFDTNHSVFNLLFYTVSYVLFSPMAAGVIFSTTATAALLAVSSAVPQAQMPPFVPWFVGGFLGFTSLVCCPIRTGGKSYAKNHHWNRIFSLCERRASSQRMGRSDQSLHHPLLPAPNVTRTNVVRLENGHFYKIEDFDQFILSLDAPASAETHPETVEISGRQVTYNVPNGCHCEVLQPPGDGDTPYVVNNGNNLFLEIQSQGSSSALRFVLRPEGSHASGGQRSGGRRLSTATSRVLQAAAYGDQIAHQPVAVFPGPTSRQGEESYQIHDPLNSSRTLDVTWDGPLGNPHSHVVVLGTGVRYPVLQPDAEALPV